MVVELFNNASMKKTVFLTCEGFPDGLQSHNRSFTVSDHFISAGNLEEGRKSGCPRIANVTISVCCSNSTERQNSNKLKERVKIQAASKVNLI